MKDSRSKICASCGRAFSWRRKWAENWDEVRYCSKRCREHRVSRIDRLLENMIIELLGRREGTICPSDAARAAFPDNWRGRMEDVRRAGRRLAAAGTIVVLQRGQRVDPAHARGAIRYGRGPAFPPA